MFKKIVIITAILVLLVNTVFQALRKSVVAKEFKKYEKQFSFPRCTNRRSFLFT